MAPIATRILLLLTTRTSRSYSSLLDSGLGTYPDMLRKSGRGYAVLFFLQIVGLAAVVAQAKTVTYDFNVSWVMANPDGLFERKVVGINGQWPLPVIEVDKGDQLVVNMHNSMDRSVSMHWHGLFQNGTSTMDGPSMLNQCPVPPGSSFTYNFTVNQNGTYWYHCHTDYCYPDGYRQALIVHDPDAPFANQFKEEFTLTMSDWYHDMVDNLKSSFQSEYNPLGVEPIPNSFLFNDTMNTSIPIEPNTTYMIRLINIGAFVAQYFYIEDHTFQIIEVDGVYTEPTEASLLYIAVAQRYSILLTTKNETDANYAIVTVADSTGPVYIPPELQLNYTNWLQYNASAPHNPAVINVSVSSDLDPFDDFTLVPYDQTPLFPEPDMVVNLTVSFSELMTGANYAFLNNISFTKPKVPTLYTALSSGDLATNAEVYGEFTHAVVLEHNSVVQVVLNNDDQGSHPFHLHGHNFQIIDRAPPIGPNFYDYLSGDPVPFNPLDHTPFPAMPVRRDVVVLPPQGFAVFRFVADNPGVWIFHCHIEWHLDAGLALMFVEAPTQLQQSLTIPQDHIDACKAGGVPYVGNAAANAVNFLDLSGQDSQPSFIPPGFTTKGIVALVFSCFSAVLGVASLTMFGVADLKVKNMDGHLAVPPSRTDDDDVVEQ